MAMVKKSITVTDQQDRWIRAQMETGNYGTDSELIREALREKQLRMNEIDVLRAKLIAAELSVEQHGWVKESPQEMLEGFKEKARQDGRL
ncbi:MAG: type II toxin-antitoxin system ParD family antitoxin [Haliea sp.]|jgi:antitoxin ParD1/3/4|nr:type II toxin-antitoxin system ParD family antitoxin [Haliea sp.]